MIVSKMDSQQNSTTKKRLRNVLGCDLLVDFFYAAASTNNAEFLCDPFPKDFMKSSNDETSSPNLRYRKKNLKDIKQVVIKSFYYYYYYYYYYNYLNLCIIYIYYFS